MKPEEAFAKFVKGALIPVKARRYLAIYKSRKGQAKILVDLCHGVEDAFIAEVVRDVEEVENCPCFVFSESQGFGADFSSITAAFDELALDDGWLIISQDGTIGIHRPEARWNAQKVIIIEK